MQGLSVPDPEIKAAKTKGVRAVVEDAKAIATKPIFEVIQPKCPIFNVFNCE